MAADADLHAGGRPPHVPPAAASVHDGVVVRRGHGSVTHPLHAHEALQAVLVEHGGAEFVVRGTTHAAQPGDIVLVESWEPHAVRALPSGATDVMALFDPAVVGAIAAGGGRSAHPVVFPAAVRRDAALRRALRAVADAREARAARLAADGAVVDAVTAMLRVAAGAPEAPGPGRGTSAAAVDRAVDYLRAHASEDVSLDALAAAAHLSKYHLAREFMRRVGRSPHAYQLHVRLGRARQLLVAGWSNAEIAATLGFADQSHFTLAFRRAFGVPPGRFARTLGPQRHRRTG